MSDSRRTSLIRSLSYPPCAQANRQQGGLFVVRARRQFQFGAGNGLAALLAHQLGVQLTAALTLVTRDTLRHRGT
jgi:hypothetical protein